MAREAIGTMHVEAINPARRGNITYALQAWSDERRATIACINELEHTPPINAIRRDPFSECCHLTVNGVGFRLLFRRDTRIQGYLPLCHDTLLSPPWGSWTREGTGSASFAGKRFRSQGPSK